MTPTDIRRVAQTHGHAERLQWLLEACADLMETVKDANAHCTALHNSVCPSCMAVGKVITRLEALAT